jgi:hypothetical protein
MPLLMNLCDLPVSDRRGFEKQRHNNTLPDFHQGFSPGTSLGSPHTMTHFNNALISIEKMKGEGIVTIPLKQCILSDLLCKPCTSNFRKGGKRPDISLMKKKRLGNYPGLFSLIPVCRKGQ